MGRCSVSSSGRVNDVRDRGQEEEHVADHPNVAMVRESFDAMDRGDLAWLDEHMSDDIVWHVGGNSSAAGTTRGKDAVRQMMTPPGPDTLKIDLHDIVGGDDHVVVLGTRGRDRSEQREERRVQLRQRLSRRRRQGHRGVGHGRERRRGRPDLGGAGASLKRLSSTLTVGRTPTEHLTSWCGSGGRRRRCGNDVRPPIRASGEHRLGRTVYRLPPRWV